MIRRLGLSSYTVAPLAARGHTIGAISLALAESGRVYDEQDLVLAEEFARRAALAVDNARLFEEARAAVRARDEVLAVVSHDLRNPLHALMGIRCSWSRRRSSNPVSFGARCRSSKAPAGRWSA
jgi:GAF domain-containing protein